MKTQQAIELLERCNKWRRGEGDVMPDTKLFGEAIDFAIMRLGELESENGRLKLQIAKDEIAVKYGYARWGGGLNAMLTHISNEEILKLRLKEANELAINK